MGVNRMTGSPWHAERVHRKEGDDRRYKGRCEYYEYNSDYCSYRSGKCIGSAHCTKYKMISEEEFKIRQKQNQKASSAKPKKGDDDCFWYD